jgi:SagB-type dehydrogenase family enzyme
VKDARDEIRLLLDTLSDYECEHLLSSMGNVAAGERFWEAGIGTVYNEHVKTRSSHNPNNDVIPIIPTDGTGIFAPIPIVKSYPGAEAIDLPLIQSVDAGFVDTLSRRRSRRDYSGGAVSMATLSTLLQHTCGVTGFTRGYGYSRLPLRSFPSCGGLQAPEVYISIQAVEGVPSGLYHYQPLRHALELMRTGNHGPTIGAIALGQPYVETAAGVFLISGYFERMRWKYGERAYRYMCMDVGFLAENLYLVGEALGLGVCAIAGFIDDAVEQLLGIDGQDELALLLATVGVPRGSRIKQEVVSPGSI